MISRNGGTQNRPSGFDISFHILFNYVEKTLGFLALVHLTVRVFVEKGMILQELTPTKMRVISPGNG